MKRVFASVCLSTALLSAPALAVLPSDLTQEIVYQASFGRADDIRLLLKKGEKPDTTNAEAVPIASLVAARRDAEALNAMRALKEAGANLDAPDAQGQTPLFYAARKGNVEMTRLLLSLNAKYDTVDKNGDTARTVAFGRGYNEIVTEIDQYILRRNEEIMAQYREYYQKMMESHQLVSEQQKNEMVIIEKQKAMLEQKQKLEQERRLTAEEDQKRLAAEVAAEQAATAKAEAELKAAAAVERKLAAATAAEEQKSKEAAAGKKEEAAQTREEEKKQKELEARRSPERQRQLIYDFSFNTCARQYWHYCRNADLDTEMSQREIADAIALHEAKIMELGKVINEDFETDGEYLKQISTPSQDWLVEQLDRMYSNRNRKEKGVGTLADAQKRCDKIAASFLLQPPKK